MIKKIWLLFCAFSLYADQLEYVDYHQAMQKDRYKVQLNKHRNKKVYSFFKKVYERAQRKLKDHRYDIPRIMHHIWLGDPLSDEFRQLRTTWFAHHPDWTFILWTDRIENDEKAIVVDSFEALDEVLEQGSAKRIIVLVKGLDFDNKPHFDASPNYGQRSDILKWEVVYRYGGAYIDCDFECYKPFDILHETFDFYTCLQPLDTRIVQLGAALFAAYPYHPILGACVFEMNFEPGPVVVRTGPIHFTNALIRNILECDGCNMVFPARYFYPCGYNERKESPSSWYWEQSFAVHHWAGSWLKPEGFERKDA